MLIQCSWFLEDAHKKCNTYLAVDEKTVQIEAGINNYTGKVLKIEMSEYDFLVLSPDEFELFCKDILEAELNIKLENFKPGKDGGIDLRYAPSDDATLIVQCKRYKDFSNLKSTLKDEVVKVRRLNPTRYILMTSVPLNPAEKHEIKDVFEGFIKSTGDIYGKDELQSILESHGSIERKHYKLWLSSTNVLSTILHNGVHNRSSFTSGRIKENISLYVPNKSYENALKQLEKNRVVILSGGPGVGKTTLADMLYLKYLSEEYKFILVSQDIDDADKLYNPDAKQLFYYDDFLGRNFLNNKLSKNEDRRIIDFMKKVMKTDNKIFIMTTREYILSQAKIEHDLLHDKKIDFNKIILNVEDYTDNVKARILYNHLYFSDLPEDFIRILVQEKTYIKIISHKNYNPRLIEIMTRDFDFSGITIEDYPKVFLKELDYPYQTWQHIFENQINEYSRLILQLLMIMGDKAVSLSNLESNFTSLNKNLGRKFEIMAFQLGIKELEKTFIRIDKDEENIEFVKFQNPSIVDFLIQYSSNQSSLNILWDSTNYFFPMYNIFSFNKVQGKITIPKNLHQQYLNSIIKRFDKYHDCRRISDKINIITKVGRYIDFSEGEAKLLLLNTFKNDYVEFSEEYTNLLIKYDEIFIEELNIELIISELADGTQFLQELINLLKIYDYYPDEFKNIIDENIIDETTNENIINYVTDDIENSIEVYDNEEVITIMDEWANIFKLDIQKEKTRIDESFYEYSLRAQFEDAEYERHFDNVTNDSLNNTDGYIEDLFESLLDK